MPSPKAITCQHVGDNRGEIQCESARKSSQYARTKQGRIQPQGFEHDEHDDHDEHDEHDNSGIDYELRTDDDLLIKLLVFVTESEQIEYIEQQLINNRNEVTYQGGTIGV